MDEPTHTEAMQTDLPSPKPNRRRRIALRFAVLVVAVSVLGAAYWFTRPPELVWWTSPAIAKTGRHVKMLIPDGWEVDTAESDLSLENGDGWMADYSISPRDKRPALLRSILPRMLEKAGLTIAVAHNVAGLHKAPDIETHQIGGMQLADTYFMRKDANVWVSSTYFRTSLPAFNRTYRQICNSLRIE
jgi:hypothetical protein